MSYRKTYQMSLSISEKIKLAELLAKTGKTVLGFLPDVQNVARSMCQNYDLDENGLVPLRGDANELQVMMHLNTLSALFGTAYGTTDESNSVEICPKPGDLLMCRYWDENEAADMEEQVKKILRKLRWSKRLNISVGG